MKAITYSDLLTMFEHAKNIPFELASDSAACHNASMFTIQRIFDLLTHLSPIDAVEVCRCRDCYWWSKQDASLQGRCSLLGIYPTGSWYCANGQRRSTDA